MDSVRIYSPTIAGQHLKLWVSSDECMHGLCFHPNKWQKT